MDDLFIIPNYPMSNIERSSKWGKIYILEQIAEQIERQELRFHERRDKSKPSASGASPPQRGGD